MSRPVTAARRYAEAAFQVALADNQLDRWQADLRLAAELFSQPQVEQVVDNPAVPLDRRLAVTDGLLASRVGPSALRHARRLVQRGRASSTPTAAW
jgi:F-type H+-transporting ATPase subunit delta